MENKKNALGEPEAFFEFEKRVKSKSTTNLSYKSL